MQGMLLVWIGLMGLAATAASLTLLRLFPGAFSESGPVVVWPWRAGATRAARTRGTLLVGAGIASLAVVIAGIALILF